MAMPANITPLQANGKPVKVELNSGDKLYSQIRDMNFSRVGNLLGRLARNLSKEYDERHDAKTVSEIKQLYVIDPLIIIFYAYNCTPLLVRFDAHSNKHFYIMHYLFILCMKEYYGSSANLSAFLNVY